MCGYETLGGSPGCEISPPKGVGFETSPLLLLFVPVVGVCGCPCPIRERPGPPVGWVEGKRVGGEGEQFKMMA